MDDLQRPPRLHPGSRIGVAAVSGPVDEQKLDRGIARLREKGYEVLEAANARSRRGFLAGDDDARTEGYRGLVDDSSVDAIFFARGGYGSSRILSRLDPGEIRKHPKIHLGGSDLTALFAFLARHAHLVTFYGPMVAIEMAGEQQLDWEHVLSGEAPPTHQFRPEDILFPGRGAGPLVGGCLSLLASLAGTPEAVRADDAILFWEDVGEEIYRLDRLLTQLERSGTFDRLQGMVIGSVVPGDKTDSPERVRAYLRDRFAGGGFPIAAGLPAGHLNAPRTIPLGPPVRLELDRGLRLEFSEPGVS